MYTWFKCRTEWEVRRRCTKVYFTIALIGSWVDTFSVMLREYSRMIGMLRFTKEVLVTDHGIALVSILIMWYRLTLLANQRDRVSTVAFSKSPFVFLKSVRYFICFNFFFFDTVLAIYFYFTDSSFINRCGSSHHYIKYRPHLSRFVDVYFFFVFIILFLDVRVIIDSFSC